MTSNGAFSKLERDMSRLAAAYDRVARDVAAASARTYQTEIDVQIAAVASGNRLRGVGKSGARIGVISKLLEGEPGLGVAIVQGTGPLHLIERDNKDHDIPRTAGSRRLRTASGRLSKKRQSTGTVLSGRQVLVINGNIITGPVHVSGSRGKHPFERGVNFGEGLASAAGHAVVANALAGIFSR